MNTVEDYIFELDGPQRAIVSYFHHLLSSKYELVSRIRYGIPFYYRRSWICYLNPRKQGGVELAFTRANELSNANSILDFRGRQQIAGIEIFSLSDIPLQSIRETINESIIMDEHIKYSVKKKSN